MGEGEVQRGGAGRYEVRGRKGAKTMQLALINYSIASRI